MHRLIYGSERIDGLYHCCCVSQTLAFVELYFRARTQNRSCAARILRAYRRRRPWINLSIKGDRIALTMPYRCGLYGEYRPERKLNDPLYGIMNLILLIKRRTNGGKTDWDYWGWFNARAKTRMSGGHGWIERFEEGATEKAAAPSVTRSG